MKKIAIVFIIIIICLAVIGTCYALYRYQSKDIDVNLYTESAASLKITDSNGAKLTLNTNELNPTNPLIKTIKLSHNKIDTTEVNETGRFTVNLSGDNELIPYIAVTATLLDDSNNTTTTIYELTELKQGVTFELTSAINLSLQVSLKEMSLDEYVSIAQKTVYINLQWKPEKSSVITPPADEIESGYYVIGDFSDWEINSKAYKLKETNDEDYKAKIDNFSEEDTYDFKVVKYNSTTKEVRTLTLNTEYIFGTKQGEKENTIHVNFPGSAFNIFVNSNEEYYITALQVES